MSQDIKQNILIFYCCSLPSGILITLVVLFLLGQKIIFSWMASGYNDVQRWTNNKKKPLAKACGFQRLIYPIYYNCSWVSLHVKFYILWHYWPWYSLIYIRLQAFRLKLHACCPFSCQNRSKTQSVKKDAIFNKNHCSVI